MQPPGPGPLCGTSINQCFWDGIREKICVPCKYTTMTLTSILTCGSEQLIHTNGKLLLFLTRPSLADRNCLPREHHDLLSRRIGVVKWNSEKPLNHPQPLCKRTECITIQMSSSLSWGLINHLWLCTFLGHLDWVQSPFVLDIIDTCFQ